MTASAEAYLWSIRGVQTSAVSVTRLEDKDKDFWSEDKDRDLWSEYKDKDKD